MLKVALVNVNVNAASVACTVTVKTSPVTKSINSLNDISTLLVPTRDKDNVRITAPPFINLMDMVRSADISPFRLRTHRYTPLCMTVKLENGAVAFVVTKNGDRLVPNVTTSCVTGTLKLTWVVCVYCA